MPTLLLTRPIDASRRFAAMMGDRLGEIAVVTAPLIGIRMVADAPEIAPDEGYILTSENAVAAIVQHGLPRRRAWAVGDRTAAAAAAAGVPVRSAAGDAASLIDLILAENEHGPLVHLRGAHARGDIATRLTAAGVPTRATIVYEQPANGLPDAVQHLTGPIVAPVFSPRTAALLTANWRGHAPMFLVAMSDAVATELAGLQRVALQIARAPDARSMADAVADQWQKAHKLEAGPGGA